jgi:hypothetical protein
MKLTQDEQDLLRRIVGHYLDDTIHDRGAEIAHAILKKMNHDTSAVRSAAADEADRPD